MTSSPARKIRLDLADGLFFVHDYGNCLAKVEIGLKGLEQVMQGWLINAEEAYSLVEPNVESFRICCSSSERNWVD